MPTLAASNLVPPSLPGPSLVDTFILERPELFLVLQLIAAAIILWRVNQHGMLGKLWYVPLICVVLGLGVYAYGNSVETVRERLMRQTGEFVDAFVGGDTARVDALLAESLTLEDIPRATNRASVLDAMDHRYIDGIRDYTAIVIGGVQDGENAGRTQMKVSVDHASLGSTRTPGIFLLGWRRTPADEWVITKLEMQRRPF